MVDNFSNSTLYIASAGVYVPPFNARQVSLPTPQSTLSVLWQAPQGQINPPPSGGSASIQWSDAPGTTSQSTPVANFSSPVHLVTVGPFSTSPAGVKVTPPPGANSLIIVTDNNVEFQVAGSVSGQLYLNDASPRINGVAFVPIDLGTDPSYFISVYFTAPGLGNIYVDASFAVQSVAIENVPLPVEISGILGGTLGPNGSLPVNQQGFNGVNVGVDSAAQPYRSLVAGSQIALEVFQRPTYHVATANVNLVANTPIITIPAPGVGNQIVLRKINLSAKANATATTIVNLQAGATNIGGWIYLLGVAADPGMQEKNFDYQDYAIGDNLAVSLIANVAIGLEYIITYGIVTTANWPQE
jgi:hypothetical protein